MLTKNQESNLLSEQSRAEQSRAEQSRAEQSRAVSVSNETAITQLPEYNGLAING